MRFRSFFALSWFSRVSCAGLHRGAEGGAGKAPDGARKRLSRNSRDDIRRHRSLTRNHSRALPMQRTGPGSGNMVAVAIGTLPSIQFCRCATWLGGDVALCAGVLSMSLMLMAQMMMKIMRLGLRRDRMLHRLRILFRWGAFARPLISATGTGAPTFVYYCFHYISFSSFLNLLLFEVGLFSRLRGQSSQVTDSCQIYSVIWRY